MAAKQIAFGWYGGKYSHLNWLLPLLPMTTHYCEPFGGSAAVLINRPPAPVETYNDIDGEVANFFRMLRDQKDDLVEAIGLTPFSQRSSSRLFWSQLSHSRIWKEPGDSERACPAGSDRPGTDRQQRQMGPLENGEVPR